MLEGGAGISGGPTIDIGRGCYLGPNSAGSDSVKLRQESFAKGPHTVRTRLNELKQELSK